MAIIKSITTFNEITDRYKEKMDNIEALAHGKPAVHKVEYDSKNSLITLAAEWKAASQCASDIIETIEFVELIKAMSETNFMSSKLNAQAYAKLKVVAAISDETAENIKYLGHGCFEDIREALDNNDIAKITALGKRADYRKQQEDKDDWTHR